MYRWQNLHAEHTDPLMNGGNHLPDTLAHARCNVTKGINDRWARHKTRPIAPLNTSRDW